MYGKKVFNTNNTIKQAFYFVMLYPFFIFAIIVI